MGPEIGVGDSLKSSVPSGQAARFGGIVDLHGFEDTGKKPLVAFTASNGKLKNKKAWDIQKIDTGYP
jgi:hypothetical protein